MSTKIPTLAPGLLSVLGLFGSAAYAVADPTQEPGQAAAPAATAPAPAPSGPPTVLLLSNGKVLQGEILKDESGYILKNKIGVMQFSRQRVERMFRSIEEAYEYKKALCPENDPDERMKLALWCLEQKMKPEAQAQLRAILEISPENRRAKAMLGNLGLTASPAAMVDPEVVRTSVEVEGAAPEQVNLNRLREEFSRNPRAGGIPTIFDLAPPLAVRRYQEFSRFVHPVLQRQCARCHNEQSRGEFQLIQTRARRDLQNELILRANLDATLRIVDREDLAHSPLLSASGMTHGAGGKPVLGGPNHPDYRVLATWVNSLKATSEKAPDATTATMAAAGAPNLPASEGFAASRLGPVADPAMPPAAKASAAIPGTAALPPGLREEDRVQVNANPTPAGRAIPGSEAGLPNNPPPDSAFAPPALDVSTYAPGTKARVGGPAAPNEPGKLAPGTPGTITLPSGEVVPVVSKEMTQKAKDDDPRKKKRINPKILDGFLKAKPAGN